MTERDAVAQPDTPSGFDAEIAQLESIDGGKFRDGETDDATEATEEGLTWIPPTDPPTVVGEHGDAVIAAGFGATADEDPFDADHHAESLYPQDEMEARILDALRASAATTALVDDLQMDVEGSRVVISGVVEDLDDEDAVVAVADSATGIDEVESLITVRAIDATTEEPAHTT